MAEGWTISARVVVNDLLTDSAHCWQCFTTVIARKNQVDVRAYGKPGFWMLTVCLLIVGVVLCCSALAIGGIVP